MDTPALAGGGAVASSIKKVAEGSRRIESFLMAAPERKRSAVISYAESEPSLVLSYLYASAMGLEVSIDDWEFWCRRQWKKLDTRAMLAAEIVSLQENLTTIREAADEGKIRPSEMPKKVADLSKELRGHIELHSKEINTHDRRSLLLAGVEIASKNLRKVFGKNQAIWPAIEAAIQATWADIEERHSL